MPTCVVQNLPYRADPAGYFSAVAHAPGAVLLDAGRPTAQRGRYDLISAWPLAELAPLHDEAANDFLQRLRSSLSSLGPATSCSACAVAFPASDRPKRPQIIHCLSSVV